MSRFCPSATIATLGLDLGKNSFHLVGQDERGAIVLRIKLSRAQLTRRLANIPPCLIGMEACAGAHHIGRQLQALGHDVRLIPAQYVKPFLKGHKNDYRDAQAIAEAVQRPTMSFVAIKTPEQMDLLALHRVRSRLVSQRTGVTNQLRGFLLERGITVRQGLAPLRQALPGILASSSDMLSPRMVRLIADLMEDWHRLDERIAGVSAEIEALAAQDEHCQRLMSAPGGGRSSPAPWWRLEQAPGLLARLAATCWPGALARSSTPLPSWASRAEASTPTCRIRPRGALS